MTPLERFIDLAAKMLRLSNFRRLRNCEVGFVERVTLDLWKGALQTATMMSVV